MKKYLASIITGFVFITMATSTAIAESCATFDHDYYAMTYPEYVTSTSNSDNLEFVRVSCVVLG
ncbi:MAG: hypothetical protein KBB88_02185 [Candidatus Pacebacteria bacterium]|nr:hypothetical protein [Candidatus Paceibacterota bacterium]